ncbi:hypothetical protein BDV41DRAFT_550798 [Aspergillus transmontanensis]|uniref:Uncharacterized protein n=1 Tax=Aspergillus transmontanensis TaxID=1034304 RepID=A0A5N6VK25_9EURO|nr:hypothetical protein BDV41DRAFT_550798 [Aspergillus transmontanensis]
MGAVRLVLSRSHTLYIIYFIVHTPVTYGVLYISMITPVHNIIETERPTGKTMFSEEPGKSGRAVITVPQVASIQRTNPQYAGNHMPSKKCQVFFRDKNTDFFLLSSSFESDESY